MDSWVLEKFVREVARQCSFVLMAFEDLERAVRERLQAEETADKASREMWEAYHAGDKERDRRLWQLSIHEGERARSYSSRIWYSIQGVLVGVGNISKLLWKSSSYSPKERRVPGRHVELRKVLSVDDDSPLKDRTFRDNLEHFDERLESWATSPTARHSVDLGFGVVPGQHGDIRAGAYHRNFDPETFTFYFRGDSYELLSVVEAVRELQRKAKAEVERLRWERPTKVEHKTWFVGVTSYVEEGEQVPVHTTVTHIVGNEDGYGILPLFSSRDRAVNYWSKRMPEEHPARDGKTWDAQAYTEIELVAYLQANANIRHLVFGPPFRWFTSDRDADGNKVELTKVSDFIDGLFNHVVIMEDSSG